MKNCILFILICSLHHLTIEAQTTTFSFVYSNGRSYKEILSKSMNIDGTNTYVIHDLFGSRTLVGTEKNAIFTIKSGDNFLKRIRNKVNEYQIPILIASYEERDKEYYLSVKAVDKLTKNEIYLVSGREDDAKRGFFIVDTSDEALFPNPAIAPQDFVSMFFPIQGASSKTYQVAKKGGKPFKITINTSLKEVGKKVYLMGTVLIENDGKISTYEIEEVLLDS